MASKERRAERRAEARAFIAEINTRTVCAHCGAQPIEWHNPEHVKLNRQHFRISYLVSQGTRIEVIREELARCTPLCRRCHMRADGRAEQFLAGRPRQPGTVLPAKPCANCKRLYKPLRRGLCSTCDKRRRNACSSDQARRLDLAAKRELIANR